MIETRPSHKTAIPSGAAPAFESLATLQQLTLEAGLSANPRQLVFRIVNHTARYCHSDRAVLWRISGKTLKLLGVSGNTEANPQSPLAVEWRNLVEAISPRDRAMILRPERLNGKESAWNQLPRRTHGLSVIWLPISVHQRVVAGLWLERWGNSQFSERDVALLEALGVAYGVAWRGVARPPNVLVRTLESDKWRKIAAAAILFVAALGLIRVPLRIVAPCEVAPRDPVVVAAPLNGVIDEIPVWPGRSVEVGDLLAIYDKRVATEEVKVARQQVEIIKSDLQRSRVQAFDSPAERSKIKLLENRLEQEKTRLGIAQHRVDKLEVRAPVRGTLMFADPHEWAGRPVQVGERLMMIVDPERTKLRIWLPEHDNINFDRDKTLTVILDSDPSSSRTARLSFVANHSQMNPDGVTCFRAEAEWVQGPSNIKMGLQGTAILFGDRVSLGYWLLRRPLAALRRFMGI